MSAFAFINHHTEPSAKSSSASATSDSPPLSPLFIEELYDSQQLNTFVNQSRTFSSPPVHESTTLFSAPQDSFFNTTHSSISSLKKKKKKTSSSKAQPSYFSFIDELDEPKEQQHRLKASSSSSSILPSQQARSAFAFIDQFTTKGNHQYNSSSIREGTLSPTSWSSNVTNNNNSSLRTKRNNNVIKPNNEMKLISAKSSHHRLQTENTNELNTLTRLYTKQLAVHDQITSLKSKIHLVQQQKDTALANEDFIIAETLHQQEQKMTSSLEELGFNTTLQKQLHLTWQRIAQLEEKEMEAAQEVAICCQEVKQERTTSFNKLVNDRERIHQQKLEAIGQKRTQLESEKSEVAFDLGIWEQSDQDLIEREEDAIHEETVKKRALVAHSELVTTEMDELKAKLKALELERQGLMDNIADLDVTMREKLKPFKQERREHEQEFEQIEQKRKEIEQKATQLDQQETQIDTEMTKHEEEKQRNLKELQELDDQILTMSNKTTTDNSFLSMTSLFKVLKERDDKLSLHTSELQRSREKILDKKKTIDSIQSQIYTQQQTHIQLDETMIEMQQKIKSLNRHKQLAIEAGRFQNAAAWTNQIKLLERDLQQLQEASARQNGSEDDVTLKVELESLNVLEQEFQETEKRMNLEIKLILEKSRDDLLKKKQLITGGGDGMSESSSSPAATSANETMIEHELKLIAVQLDLLYQQQDLVSFH